jgi:hypothetical protein
MFERVFAREFITFCTKQYHHAEAQASPASAHAHDALVHDGLERLRIVPSEEQLHGNAR